MVKANLALISIMSAAFAMLIPRGAFPPQAGMAAVPISRVDLATLKDDEFKKILSIEAKVGSLAASYNYDFADAVYWPTLLHCPLWTKNVALEFESREVPGRASSTFVVLLGSSGTLELVPLFYHGLAPTNYDAPLDPHNIATFNRVIAEEPPSSGSDSIWLQEALCYLGIVMNSPRLVLPQNIRELIQTNDDQVIQRLSPVSKISEKTVEVLLYEVIADERDIVEWTLRFDRKGFLRDVHRERKRRSAVLNSRSRN
jgi:hypothetical protein